MPERPKGTGCKPVGSAYGGSNPPAPTLFLFAFGLAGEILGSVRRALWFGSIALALLLAPTALAANTPPTLKPIQAVFDQTAFATNYSASATDADGDTLKMTWTLAPPTQDPKCNKFATVSSTKAIWHHGDKDGCNHAVQGPRGHKGIVHFYVSDGTWVCMESYDGTLTGTGGAAACFKSAPPPKATCTGQQFKLFDNSNGFGVQNGGKPPTFSTKGKSYCVVSITTYHWNNGKGQTPGWLGLTGSSTVGPSRASGSAGQGGAPNVNWTLNIPQSKPAIINGTYSCTDNAPATWSQNQQTGGKGFCIVYVTNAVTTPAKPAPTGAATYKCSGGQVKLFDNSNGGGVLNGAKPPSFGTNGKAYCLASITTYHWNSAQGKKPGTIGLTGSSTAGPFAAKGSSGQGGAPNVNWTVNVSTTTKPVILNGTYSCNDSDPASWSQNPQTGGKGFCIVYVTNAVKSAGTGSTTTTKKKTTTTTPAKKKKSSGKLSIKAAPDTGNPPLTVTFTLSSPKVVQWRVDFGDGQSKVAIGQPPGTLTHTYIAKGDYKPRITVITSPTATTSSSATTNVQVGTALMSFAASPASGSLPLKVTFTLGTSVVNITTWAVDFGDGQHTAGGGKPPASVTHTYTKAGTYRAVFSVKPGHYALVASFAQVTAGGGTPPVLSLSAAPTSGRHPLKVTFTLGTNIPGTIVSWEVVFGDGFRTSGSGKPPATVSHSYARAGTYGAYLVVAQQQRYGGVQYIVPRGGLGIAVK